MSTALAAEAERVETPCGDGGMVWRVWGSGPPLVLFHGGYGSWMHWIRNVLPLSRDVYRRRPRSARARRVGDAARTAYRRRAGPDHRRRARCILPGEERFHLAGFSFGGVLGGHVAASLGEQVRGFTIVGSNGLGLPRQPTELERQRPGGNRRKLLAIAAHNLGVLMIADKDKIDDLAVYIQYAERAARPGQKPAFFARRHAGPGIAAGDSAADGIWGGRDATAYPYLDERASACSMISSPALRFEVIPGAGHWVAYEAADRFNPLLAEIVSQRRGASP